MSVHIYIQPSLLDRIKERAAKESRSVSAMVRVLLQQSLAA